MKGLGILYKKIKRHLKENIYIFNFFDNFWKTAFLLTTSVLLAVEGYQSENKDSLPFYFCLIYHLYSTLHLSQYSLRKGIFNVHWEIFFPADQETDWWCTDSGMCARVCTVSYTLLSGNADLHGKVVGSSWLWSLAFSCSQ